MRGGRGTAGRSAYRGGRGNNNNNNGGRSSVNYSLDYILKNNLLVEFTYDMYVQNQKNDSIKNVYRKPRKPAVWIMKHNNISGNNNWSKSILFSSSKSAAEYIFINRGEKSANNITYSSGMTGIEAQVRHVCTRALLEEEMTSESSKFDPINNINHKKTWDNYATSNFVCGYKCQYYSKSDLKYLQTCNDQYVNLYN